MRYVVGTEFGSRKMQMLKKIFWLTIVVTDLKICYIFYKLVMYK